MKAPAAFRTERSIFCVRDAREGGAARFLCGEAARRASHPGQLRLEVATWCPALGCVATSSCSTVLGGRGGGPLPAPRQQGLGSQRV